MDACRSASGFGQTHFGSAALKDRRRTARLVALADRILEHPEGSWPSKLADPAELQAWYRLANRPEVTHRAVLAPHAAGTLERMREQAGPVLIVHDTTELDYSGLTTIDLSPIGNGHGSGYLCHNSLAVTPGGEILGLANQILFRRPRPPRKETKSASAKRPGRESRLWKRGSAAIPAAPEGKVWVDVADRGADLTEFLAYESTHGKHFVVRSKANRKVVLNPQKLGKAKLLHNVVRRQPAQDRRPLCVPAGKGRRARDTEVAVAFTRLQIVPPRQARGEHGRELLTVWAVRVWEPKPPAGVKALEWILLSNVPVQTVGDAWERVNWYVRRWTVEELHKTMKSGCAIEQMQFTTEGALQPAIALLSVVAVALMWLRQVSRTPEARTRRAAERFPKAMIAALAAWRWGQARTDLSVYEFCFALARLGGHQNRKHDHPPGLVVLCRGWTKLQWLTAGRSTATAGRCGET